MMIMIMMIIIYKTSMIIMRNNYLKIIKIINNIKLLTFNKDNKNNNLQYTTRSQFD